MLRYMDGYREFLAAELARRIGANPRYSQRAFAKALGLSPGELSEILRGKRPLSAKHALQIARALGLSEAERRRLLALSQGETERPTPSAYQLSADLFALVSDWYCFAIVYLAECEGFRWDERWIGR